MQQLPSDAGSRDVESLLGGHDRYAPAHRLVYMPRSVRSMLFRSLFYSLILVVIREKLVTLANGVRFIFAVVSALRSRPASAQLQAICYRILIDLILCY